MNLSAHFARSAILLSVCLTTTASPLRAGVIFAEYFMRADLPCTSGCTGSAILDGDITFDQFGVVTIDNLNDLSFTVTTSAGTSGFGFGNIDDIILSPAATLEATGTELIFTPASGTDSTLTFQTTGGDVLSYHGVFATDEATIEYQSTFATARFSTAGHTTPIVIGPSIPEPATALPLAAAACSLGRRRPNRPRSKPASTTSSRS